MPNPYTLLKIAEVPAGTRTRRINSPRSNRGDDPE